MADDKAAADAITEQVAAPVETAAEPVETPLTMDVSKDAAVEDVPVPASASASADLQEDTYESVSPPADIEKLQAEQEKTNGTAAAAAIEVPLDEDEAVTQPLTGDKDAEAGGSSEPKSPSLGVHMRILAVLKKREVLFPVIGGITFLLGLILIITALMMVHGKCDIAVTPAKNGKSGQVVTYPDITHMATHDHVHNSTVDETLLENVAIGRPAFQSSTFTDKLVSLNASLATDGNTGNSMTKNECAQTERMEHPEWYVDLQVERVVNQVRIYIPSNCCVGELHDFIVRVGSGVDRTQNPACKHFMGTALRPTIVMDCDEPITGRFVSIHMLGDDNRTRDRLSICEVLVYSRKTATPPPSGV